MIPYKIFPMFHLGPLHVNMYGIMFALSVLVASLLAVKRAEKKGINKNVIWDMVLYILVSVIIGSRLFYVFFYWPEGMPLTLFSALAIWNGGLAFFGGFLGAVVAGYFYAKKKNISFWILADIFAIPLVVGHIFGRFGDYFTGGHPGKITSLPWGIFLEDAVRHPIMLYEIIGLVIIVVVLLNLERLKLFDGFLFSSYVMLYSAQRMFLDFFRLESTDPKYLGLTPSQYLVIILAIVSGFFIIKKIRPKVTKL